MVLGMEDDPLAWEVAVLAPARPPRIWVPRLGAALRSGVRAGVGPGVFVFVAYYLAHRELDMPWLKIATVLALYAPGVGITLALTVEALVMVVEQIVARVRWLVPVANSVVAAGLAGAICGVLPGAIGVVVFGGYRGPFVGTALIATSLMSGALLVAVPAARRARRHTQKQTAHDTRAVVVATLVATLILGAVAAVIAPLLVDGAFVRVAGEIDRHGATVGAVVGAMGGTILGLYIGLVIALARRVGGAPRAA